MAWRTIFVIVIVTISVMGGGVATAQSADDWPSTCEEGPTITEGKYSGTVEGADDRDAFEIRLDRGNYITITIDVPEEAEDPYLLTYADTKNEEIGVRGEENVGVRTSSSGTTFYPQPGETVTMEIWAKQDIDPLCFIVSDGDWQTQYTWELSYERAYPDATLYNVRELEEEIADLREQANEQDGPSEPATETGTETKTNDDLEEELERKEERIEELEAKVNDLETQLENENGVIFNIEVTPSDGEEFAVNEYAVITVNAEHASPSELQVRSGSEEYDVGDDGTARLPLDEAGERPITFEHDGESEEIVLDVAAADQSGGEGPEEQTQQDDGGDGGGSDVGLAGTIGLGIVAVLGGLYKLVVSS